VGEEEEYTLGKSITEGNKSFGGRTVRSPEVTTTMERRKERKKEGLDQTIMYLKGTSLTSALMWFKGVIEGGTLLSTMARAELPHLYPGLLWLTLYSRIYI
jgi:hypothetical protein